MKSMPITPAKVLRSIKALEFQLNESLSKWLFGTAADADYADLPLPSEREDRLHKEEKPAKERPNWLKRSRQLQLLFVRSAKNVLYRSILIIEAVFRRREVEYENVVRKTM